MIKSIQLPLYSILAPILAWIVFFAAGSSDAGWMKMLVGIGLVGSVLAAVHHAEVVAHRVGEPYGTIILALAVTMIETGLIITLMLGAKEGGEYIARDTVLAATMILITGIAGVSLFLGGLRHREQSFGLDGARTAIATLFVIVVLVLVLPNFTTSVEGASVNNSQLIFIGVSTLVLYLSFLFIQMTRHRDYFLSPVLEETIEETPHSKPNKPTTFSSLFLLFLCLGAVVLNAKLLSPSVESTLDSLNAPRSMVGIVIAIIVLLPEALAAIRAAGNNRFQTSLNLTFGSALACIGLTIPVVILVANLMGLPLVLGVDNKSMLLLFLSIITMTVSLGAGKTNIMHGIILIVIFLGYLFLTLVP